MGCPFPNRSRIWLNVYVVKIRGRQKKKASEAWRQRDSLFFASWFPHSFSRLPMISKMLPRIILFIFSIFPPCYIALLSCLRVSKHFACFLAKSVMISTRMRWQFFFFSSPFSLNKIVRNLACQNIRRLNGNWFFIFSPRVHFPHFVLFLAISGGLFFLLWSFLLIRYKTWLFGKRQAIS